MTDTQNPGHTPPGDRDNSGWIILGAVLVIVGFFLGAHNLGLVPWQLAESWRWFTRARSGVGVILLGIALIVWAQSGRRITLPRSGGKLTRSRSEKWVAGVLGGLAAYFGIDVTLLRLAFIALVVLFDIGGLIIAYIVMAIVVPLEPREAAVPPAPGQPAQWPSGVPSAAPAPPPAPVAAPAAPAPVTPPTEVPAAPPAVTPVAPAVDVPAAPATDTTPEAAPPAEPAAPADE